MKYTYVFIDPKSGYPFVFLNKNNNEEKTCPFLVEVGCFIYEDRPATCRYYPLGKAFFKKLDITKNLTEENYFFVREPHCKGFEKDKEWTVEEWRKDQGVDLYDDINRGWIELLFPKKFKAEKLDDKKSKAFYMACYDIDTFRRFVFESRFLNVFEIPNYTLTKIKNDEVELLSFAFDYMKFLLMIKNTLKLKKSLNN
jgi:hypothetical protein